MEASNFRSLFLLQYNQWAKTPKTAHELWPLAIDNVETIPIEEVYERNKRMVKYFRKDENS